MKNSLIVAFGSGVCVIIILTFFVICVIQLLKGEKGDPIRKMRIRKFGLFVILFNIIGIVYVCSCQMIYFWDSAGFWQTAIMQSALLPQHAGTFLKDIISSINYDDYNYVLSTLPSIFAKLISPARLIFVLVIINFYALPSIYLLIKASFRFMKADYTDKTRNLSWIFALLALPLVVILSAQGFVDVAGLIFCGLILYLYFKSEKNLFVFGAIGFLLLGLFLVRRWYLFWVIGFFICAIVHQVIVWRNNKQSLKETVQKLILMVACFFVPLVVFFQNLFVNKILKTDYSALYVAYKFPLMADFNKAIMLLGIFAIVAFIAFAIFLIIRKKYNCIFLFVHSIIVFTMFHMTQGHGDQHFLLYFPTLFIILVAGAGEILHKYNQRKPTPPPPYGQKPLFSPFFYPLQFLHHHMFSPLHIEIIFIHFFPDFL